MDDQETKNLLSLWVAETVSAQYSWRGKTLYFEGKILVGDLGREREDDDDDDDGDGIFHQSMLQKR